MGIQFFWFYDLLILLIAAGIIIKCAHKGFISSFLGVVSIFLAFAAASYVSEFAFDTIYNTFVSEPLKESVNNYISELSGGEFDFGLENVDMTKIKVNGRYLDAYNLEPDTAGNVTLDMSNTDVTETGLQNANIIKFGFKEDTDFSKLNIGTVQIMQSELQEEDIYTLILAHILSFNNEGNELTETVSNITAEITSGLPEYISDPLNSLVFSKDTLNYNIIKFVLAAEENDYAGAILDGLLKPTVIIPIKALIFLIIFAIIIILLGIICRLLEIVHSIPIINSINAVLGAALGVAEAFAVIIVVCLLIHVFITVSGNSLIFFNTMTIDKTFAFKYIYYSDVFDYLI